MTLRYDPEFQQGLEEEIASLPSTLPSDDDFQGRRKVWEQVQIRRNTFLPEVIGVDVAIYHIPISDEVTIPIYRVYPISSITKDTLPGPAILHAHSGGMVVGSVQFGLKRLRLQASVSNLQIFSVDYRLAPESPHPGPVDDCFTALKWLSANTKEFNIDPARIAVMGESAGGGLAAAVALMARDHDLQPRLAKQILIYPMLDDRNIHPNETLEPFTNWNYHNNLDAWSAILGGVDKVGANDTDSYAAPARAKSLADLPSTYIEVGVLDIFRNESIDYAHRLIKENIDCELHVYSGVGHSFGSIVPLAEVSTRALRNQYKAMKGF